MTFTHTTVSEEGRELDEAFKTVLDDTTRQVWEAVKESNYRVRQRAILEKMAKITRLLREHDRDSRDWRNFGHLGDLGSVMESLTEIDEFLS